MTADLVGLTGHASTTVGETDLATALGSGDVRVFGTPAALALCEAATVAAIAEALDPSTTSVGAHVELDHLAPSKLGSVLGADAEVTEVAGSRVTFRVEAREGDQVVARALVVRYIVDRARFA
jgi:fluoroacetyl-CoA thioesterase